MAIVASVLIGNDLLKDGRRWVREQHTDQAAIIYLVEYMADIGVDVSAAMAARVSTLNANLISTEIASNVAAVQLLGSLASPKLVYSTAAANFSALRTAYATATQKEAIMTGDYLSTLTDAQLQTAFSLTAGQVTTLRSSKLTPAASAAATIRAATGA